MKRIFLLILFIVTGCTVFSSNKAISIKAIRPIAPSDLKQASITINRQEYVRAVQAEGSAPRLRVIAIMPGQASMAAIQEYRIFGVTPGSAAALLGLRNSDILVAANEYIVRAPGQFYTFLQFMETVPEASIEIRRNRTPIIIKFKFV